MGKCRNDLLLNKINVNKLNKNTEVDLTVLHALPDCRKIDTGKPVAVSAEAYSYNRFTIPANQFECMREGCVNTGTLTFTGEESETATYRAVDATEWGSGVITFYAKAGSYPATISVSISDTQVQTNADVYSVTLAADRAAADGFIPVVIDLSQTPSSVTGTGWAAGSVAYIAISGTVISISSISIFDSLEDFAINNVVKVSCLSELGGDMSFETLEATCWESGYDETADPSFDITVTGQSVTPNYFLLNPIVSKGTATEGFDMVTVEKTIAAGSGALAGYGVIQLADAQQDQCGYFSVQLADNCNVTDAELIKLSIPTLVAVDEGHYLVIKNSDGTTDVVFNQALVGAKVLISYPQEVAVESYESDADTIGDVKVMMSYSVEHSDGTKWRFTFDDVLVTSFPMTINQDTTEFSFTLRIQKAKFRRERILN